MENQKIRKIGARRKASNDTVGQVVRNLTEVIKKRRQSLGISQQTLAETAGLDRGYLISIESARRNPSIITLVQIACGLKIPASELLGLAESEAGEMEWTCAAGEQ